MAMHPPTLTRVPVWAWRALMAHIGPGERRRFSRGPIEDVNYALDIDYAGDGIPQHRLDVIAPAHAGGRLPVYIYFHGGGWTSGDKATLTRYCASQARAGMVVVNVNYRMAPRFQMRHILQDANEVAAWVVSNIASYGGDPDAVVLGGDSAGGQIAALLAALSGQPELAAHHELNPVLPATAIRGVVQHCSVVDFSVIFERGFILGLGFVRMLLPARGRGLSLPRAVRFLSPVEWIDSSYPPVLVTTSRKDYFFRANLNFIDSLASHGVPFDLLIDDTAPHTWQQNSRHPASAIVYARLHAFVARVTRDAEVFSI